MGAPSKFDLDAVEAALVTAVAAGIAAAAPGCSVESISEKDFNDSDQLVMRLPAIRIRFNAAPFIPTVANSYSSTYRVLPQFDLLCAAKNLTSKAAQAQASLVLARQALGAIAGVSLGLTDGTKTEPVKILGVSRFLDDEAGMVYVATVEANGFAQFLPTGGGS